MADAESRTPLSELVAAMSIDGDISRVSVPADWLQGRAIYGGLSVALCLQAIYDHLGADLPPLRSVQCSFIGPSGSDIAIRPTVLRRGKSTAFVAVDLLSESGIAARAVLCFGKARESAVDHSEFAAPQVPDPDHCEQTFFQAAGRLAPNFTQHFDSRFVGGSMPMNPAESPQYTVWVRHKDSQIDPLIVGLAALADALPPAAMVCFSQPAPISSMTWHFDVLSDTPQTQDGWWLSRSSAEHARNGYSSQAMTVWNRAGDPVIIGRQNIAIFH